MNLQWWEEDLLSGLGAPKGAVLGDGKVLHLECGGGSPEVYNIEAHQTIHLI